MPLTQVALLPLPYFPYQYHNCIIVLVLSLLSIVTTLITLCISPTPPPTLPQPLIDCLTSTRTPSFLHLHRLTENMSFQQELTWHMLREHISKTISLLRLLYALGSFGSRRPLTMQFLSLALRSNLNAAPNTTAVAFMYISRHCLIHFNNRHKHSLASNSLSEGGLPVGTCL